MKKTLLPFLILLFGSLSTIQAQLFIDDSYTVEQMVMDFFDSPNISVSNVSSSSGGVGIAFFEANQTDLGLDAGILLTSGIPYDAIGPNNAQGKGVPLGIPGDPDIDLLSNSAGSFDAISIEFDFTVVQSDYFHFNYVFGSEEYPEFVNSQFNDAFAFFISGPGYSGPFSGNAENISMIPGTNTPVEINTVNDFMNQQYYIDNQGGNYIQYDGFTDTLPASFYALAGETYHAKIIVSDRGDAIYDSGVFLSFNSLTQNDSLVPISEFSSLVISNSAQFTNTSRYGRSWTWDFGNGESSVQKNPSPVYYDDEGDYTVNLVTTNYCCKDSYFSMITVDSLAQLTANIATTNNPLNCHGDANATIDLQIVGGVLPLVSTEWNPSIPDLNNVGAGTYQYTVVDSEGTTFMGNVVISAPEELVLNTNTVAATSGIANGSATVAPFGGTPPYNYQWSNGAVGETAIGLSSGDYEVEVTDANGCQVRTLVTVDFGTNILEKQEFDIQIFPNPVKDKMQIESLELSNLQQIEIFDALGKSIPMNFEASGNGTMVRFQSELSRGIYFINIELKDGRKTSTRFIAE